MDTSPNPTHTTYTTSSASAYPDSYHDDGLGAIGRAVTSPAEAQYPAGNTATYVSTESTYSYSSRAPVSPSATGAAVVQPRPQHLASHGTELLAHDYEPHGSGSSFSAHRESIGPPAYEQATAPVRVMEKGRLV
jgi:hypothetical protein